MLLKRKALKKRIIVLIIILLLITAYIILDSAIRPAVFSLAETKLRAIASQSVNYAVKEAFGSGISYSDFINIEKDETGKIKLLSANAANINSLASIVSSAVQEEITNIGQQGIDIPIGTIIGGTLLSGRGPSINVKVEPVGYVNTEFLSAFEDAGINQTRHKIFLAINISMKIVVANEVKQVDYSSNQLIADTVIVGEIPQQYMRFYDLGGMQSLAPMLLMDEYSDDNSDQ